MKKMLAEIKATFVSLILWLDAEKEHLDGFTLLTKRLPSGLFVVSVHMREPETGAIVPAAGVVIHADAETARNMAYEVAIRCRTFARLRTGAEPLWICDECLWSDFQQRKQCPMCLGARILPREKLNYVH